MRIVNCPGIDPVMSCKSAIDKDAVDICSRCRAAAARRDRASTPPLPPETGECSERPVHPRKVAVGVQSRYYDSAASAALFYEAEGRTALGTSTVVAGATGASGGGSNVVRNTDLFPTWQAILSTQAASAGAHLSNVGSFRVWARTYQSTGNTGAVSVRLEWGEGDFRRRTLNDAVNFAAGERGGQFVLVDLGLVHLTEAVQGTQRWEGRVLAKSTVTGDEIDVDCLFLFPVDEGYTELSGVWQSDTPTSFTARDEFNQTAGALAGKTVPSGGTWAAGGLRGHRTRSRVPPRV